eukprot:1159398-Pelagomonas_calceolata.AAC.21
MLDPHPKVAHMAFKFMLDPHPHVKGKNCCKSTVDRNVLAEKLSRVFRLLLLAARRLWHSPCRTHLSDRALNHPQLSRPLISSHSLFSTYRLMESGLSFDLPSPPGSHSRRLDHQHHRDPQNPSAGAARGVAESLSAAEDIMSTTSVTELDAEHLPPPPMAEDARRHGSSAQSCSDGQQQQQHQRGASVEEEAFPPCSYSIKVFTADT